MLAVVPVRAGQLPAGGAEAAVEAGGVAVVVGDGVEAACQALAPWCQRLYAVEAGPFAPARFAAQLAPLARRAQVVVLPGSPDGRDLAPRLAAAMPAALLTGAIRVEPQRIVVTRWGGRVSQEHRPTGPVVATLDPASRSLPPAGQGPGPEVLYPADPAATDPAADPAADTGATAGDTGATAAGSASGATADTAGATATTGSTEVHGGVPGGVDAGADARVLHVSPPDPASVDLAEAPRIVAGGAGLGSADRFVLLEQVATALGATMGATRVVTDAGWVDHRRQIGTTGVSVQPRVYVALGISGAVQHTGGLGQPDHVVSVNLDASCPMMAMADLALVTDAGGLLDALADRLGLGPGDAGASRGSGR